MAGHVLYYIAKDIFLILVILVYYILLINFHAFLIIKIDFHSCSYWAMLLVHLNELYLDFKKANCISFQSERVK